MMKSSPVKASLAAAAILGLVAIGTTPSLAGNRQPAETVDVAVTVTNVQTISDANKLADAIRVQGCVVAADAVAAPAAPDATCQSFEVNEDSAAIADSTLTSFISVAKPAVDQSVKYAFFVSNKNSRDLGLAAKASAGQLVDITATGASAGVTHALPTIGTVVEGGRVGNGTVFVGVNYTVTNFPSYFGNSKGKEKLRSLIKVDVYKLPADATTAPATPADLSTDVKATKKTYEENAKPVVLNGVLSGSVNIKVPTAESGLTSQNYAVYLSLKTDREHSKKGIKSQLSAGQFVTATKNADTGIWTVTAGLDGLTLDFTANAGTVANPAVISVDTTAMVGNWGVLVTKTDSKGNVRTVALIEIPAGATSVALPAGLEKGSYTAQLVVLNNSSPFSIDDAKNLTAPVSLTPAIG